MPVRDPATLDKLTLKDGKTYEGTVTYIGQDTILFSLEIDRHLIESVELGTRPDPELEPF